MAQLDKMSNLCMGVYQKDHLKWPKLKVSVYSMMTYRTHYSMNISQVSVQINHLETTQGYWYSGLSEQPEVKDNK